MLRATMLTITGLEEARAQAGEELGVSDWHEVTQDEIDPSPTSPGPPVDPRRSRARDPDAVRRHDRHGYYTLSLHPRFAGRSSLRGLCLAVNYG